MKLSHVLSFGLQVLLVESSALQARGGPGNGVPGKRPQINVHPKSLGHHLPGDSPGRTKVCSVKGGTSDDSTAILKAFQNCNNGGHVIFNTGTTYTVGKPLDLRFLKHVDWGMYHFNPYNQCRN
jgi:hypothetical protein